MEKFRFMDSEGKNIYVYKWAPKEEDIKGVIQIAHGMTETALRYSYFAEKLNDAGFVVYANDHRGHGNTACTKEELGYIADEDGFHWMVEDLKELTDIIKMQYQQQQYYIKIKKLLYFKSKIYTTLWR